MKNYEQMAREVLQARDDWIRRKQKRQKMFRRYMPIGASFCFAVLIGLNVWKAKQELPEIPHIPEQTVTETTIVNIHTGMTETQTLSETTESVIETTIPSVTESGELTQTSVTAVTAYENSIRTEPTTVVKRAESQESVSETQASAVGTEPEIPEETDIPQTSVQVMTEIIMTTATTVQMIQTTQTVQTSAVTAEPQENGIQTTSAPTITDEVPATIPPSEIPQEPEIILETSDPNVTGELPGSASEDPLIDEQSEESRMQIRLSLTTDTADNEIERQPEAITFSGTDISISTEYLEGFLATSDIIITDNDDNEEKTLKNGGIAFSIRGISSEIAVAVQIDSQDKYLVFLNSAVSPEECRALLNTAGIS